MGPGLQTEVFAAYAHLGTDTAGASSDRYNAIKSNGRGKPTTRQRASQTTTPALTCSRAVWLAAGAKSNMWKSKMWKPKRALACARRRALPPAVEAEQDDEQQGRHWQPETGGSMW
jgi:hypothetical protein